MNGPDRRGWTAAIFIAMALTGVVMQMRGAVLPTLQTQFGTPEWQLGLVAPAGTVGYTLVILLTGFGAGSLAPRRLVGVGLLGGGLAVVLMGLSPVFAVFLLGIAAVGAMNGLVRGLNRPLLSHLYPHARGRVYNYYDMAWAVGAMLGPLLVIAAIAMGDWRLAFLGVALAWFAVGTYVFTLPSPGISTDERQITRADVLPLLRRPEVLAMGGAMFLGTGVEASLFTWLPIYAGDALPETITLGLGGVSITVALAEATLSIMLAGYVPGRFVYANLSERFGYARLLVVILALLVPLFATTFVLVEGVGALFGIFAIGALISGIYPMLVTYATEAVPEHSGPVTALAATSSSLGFGVLPAVLGGVISATDTQTAMELLVVPLLGSLAIVVAARLVEVRAARR